MEEGEATERAEGINQSPARSHRRVKGPRGCLCASGRTGTLEEADSQVAQCSAGGSAPAEKAGIRDRRILKLGDSPVHTPALQVVNLKRVPFPS